MSSSTDNLWAGISGIPYQGEFTSGNYRIFLNSRLSLTGKVPESQPMVNFSILNKVLTGGRISYESPEMIPEKLAMESLERNSFLESSKAILEGNIVFRDGNGRNIETGVSISYTANRKGGNRFSMNLSSTGITACPCSMGKIRERLVKKYPAHSKSIQELPQITHNQRVKFSILVDAAETVRSLPSILLAISKETIGNLLSHNQSESEVNDLLLEAHEKPMLIEDLARAGAKICGTRLAELHTVSSAKIVCESEESIHSYNAKSEILVRF